MGVRDLGLLKSAVAQPKMTFGGEDLYPGVIDKAAALAFSIIKNHPLIDGKKRTSHAAMETFLILNGLDIVAAIDEQEQMVLMLADGQLRREDLTGWLKQNVAPV